MSVDRAKTARGLADELRTAIIYPLTRSAVSGDEFLRKIALADDPGNGVILIGLDRRDMIINMLGELAEMLEEGE